MPRPIQRFATVCGLRPDLPLQAWDRAEPSPRLLGTSLCFLHLRPLAGPPGLPLQLTCPRKPWGLCMPLHRQDVPRGPATLSHTQLSCQALRSSLLLGLPAQRKHFTFPPLAPPDSGRSLSHVTPPQMSLFFFSLTEYLFCTRSKLLFHTHYPYRHMAPARTVLGPRCR